MFRSLLRTARPRRPVQYLALGLLAIAIPASAWASSGAQRSLQAPARGDTLTVGASYFPPNLNPTIIGNSGPGTWGSELGYEPLVRYDTDGSFKPALATKWAYVGTKKFNLTVRGGVKFGDGTPVTTDAVVASLRYSLLSPGFARPWVANVTAINKTGPSSVTISCKASCPQLPFALSQNIGLGSIISPAGLADKKKLESSQYGAGPYVFNTDESVAGDHFTWDANPNYWNQSAIHWKRVVMRIIGDNNARVASLSSGQVDIILDVPAADVATVKSRGAKITTAPCCFQGVLFTDRTGRVAPQLKDVRVRQALNYAVDRKAIAKALGKGYASASAQMTGSGSGAYDPMLDSMYPYNPKKAKQLLAAAGYPNGFTVKVETVNIGETKNYMLATLGYWEKVGVKANVTTATTVAGWLAHAASKKFPVMSYGYGTLPFAYQINSFFTPKSGGGQNAWTIDAKGAALLVTATNAPPAKQNSLYKVFIRHATEQAYAVPLVQFNAIHAYNKNVVVPPITANNYTPVLIKVTPA